MGGTFEHGVCPGTRAWSWALLCGLVTVGGRAWADGGRPGGSTVDSPSASRVMVLASWDDGELTVDEVVQRLSELPPSMRPRGKVAIRAWVTRQVEQRLLAEYAKGLGLLKQMPHRRRVEDARITALVDAHLARTVKSPTEGEVRAFVRSHATELGRPRLLRAHHILHRSEAEARATLSELSQGRVDLKRFGELAQKRSVDDETKYRGGDLRYFDAQGRTPRSPDAPVEKALAEAVFEVGQVGKLVPRVVRVGRFFSVLMVTGERPGRAPVYDAVRGQARRLMVQRRRREAYEALVGRLFERARVKTYPRRLVGD